MGAKWTTYVVKPIIENSPIYGLFFIRVVEEETGIRTRLELMEIVGKGHRRILKYIRDNFL